MKKGFTLIELLVVMVIVGILITIGMPKYKTAMERGRGLEGIANAGAISDAANAYYLQNYNTYGSSADLTGYINRVSEAAASKFFQNPQIALSGNTVTVTLQRTNINEKTYKIVFVNQDGNTTQRYCVCVRGTGCERYCKALGANTPRSGGGWLF